MLFHLFNAQSSVEVPFCKSVVDANDLTSIQYYLQCRLNNLSAPMVCTECKAAVIKWIEDSCSRLEAEVQALRDKAKRLLENAEDSRRKAGGDRSAMEHAARDAERFERSAERAGSEADDLQEEARVRRQFVEQLRTEILPET